MSYCEKCGFTLKETAKFCDNCGEKVVAQQLPQTAGDEKNGNYDQTEKTASVFNNQPLEGTPPPQQNAQFGAQGQNFNNLPPQQNAQFGAQGQNFNNLPPQQNVQFGAQGQNFNNAPPQHNAQFGAQGQNFNNAPPQHNNQYANANFGNPANRNTVTMQYNGNKNVTAGASNKTIIIVGVAIFAVVVIILGLLIVPQFINGNSDDPNIGVWEATEASMLGVSIKPEDAFEGGASIELKSGNECNITLNGEVFNVRWKLDGTTFKLIDGSDEFTGTLIGNELKLVDLLGLGVDLTFVKEGTTTDNNAGDTDADIDTATQAEGDENSSDTIAPDYAAEETIEASTLSNPSFWYGEVNISDYEGTGNLDGSYEAWGYIASDSVGDYFELFINAPKGSNDAIVMASFYIDLYDHTFYPFANDDGWLYNYAPLEVEDEVWFSPILLDGDLTASYDFEYESESFNFTYSLRQIAD